MIHCENLEADTPECQFVRTLYESAFPVDERRNFSDVVRLSRQNRAFDIKLIYDKNSPVGFMTLWTWADWRYIEHFAIDDTCRGRGVGTEVLWHLLHENDTPVVLEVELPCGEWSRKRIGFYIRLGFVLHADFPYIQPAYEIGRNSLPMHLMTWGADGTFDLNAVVRRLYREVYGCCE